MAYGKGKGSDTMKLEKQISCVKYTLFCFNAVIWILGCAMLGLTVWLKMEPGFAEWISKLQIEQFYIGIYVLVTASVVVILTAIVGCCGSLMENQMIMFIFIVTQVICFICGLAGSAVLLNFSTLGSQIQPLIRRAMRSLIADVYNPESIDTLKMIQENIGCCGADGASDYFSLKTPLPSECRDTVTGNTYFYGCVDEMTWFLEDKTAWLSAIALTICFVCVINTVLTTILIQALRKEEKLIHKY